MTCSRRDVGPDPPTDGSDVQLAPSSLADRGQPTGRRAAPWGRGLRRPATESDATSTVHAVADVDGPVDPHEVVAVPSDALNVAPVCGAPILVDGELPSTLANTCRGPGADMT